MRLLTARGNAAAGALSAIKKRGWKDAMSAPAHKIIDCMRSACFPKGNTATIHAVQDYIKSKGLQDSIKIMGTLCQQKCREEPNIQIDEERICGVDPARLPELLDNKLGL